MPNAPALRRLIDLPGIRDIEFKALMNPRLSDEGAAAEYPEIDECSRAVFGLTQDEADEVARPDGWDRIERKSARDQVAAFEAEGWDVTDDKRRPLRMLGQFSTQLWLAIRGVAGELPFQPDTDTDDLTSSLAAEAARFRRNKI